MPTETDHASAYWFTKHWPHPHEHCHIPWYIYLQDDHKERGELLEPGDMIVFYETGKGQWQRFKGEVTWVRNPKGRIAVVGIAEVSDEIRLAGEVKNLEYKDRPKVKFAWEVPCKNHKRGQQNVAYVDVLKIMQTGDPYIIKGGIKQIDKATYDQFLAAMGKLSPCPAPVF